MGSFKFLTKLHVCAAISRWTPTMEKTHYKSSNRGHQKDWEYSSVQCEAWQAKDQWRKDTFCQEVCWTTEKVFNKLSIQCLCIDCFLTNNHAFPVNLGLKFFLNLDQSAMTLLAWFIPLYLHCLTSMNKPYIFQTLSHQLKWIHLNWTCNLRQVIQAELLRVLAIIELSIDAIDFACCAVLLQCLKACTSLLKAFAL